LSQTRINTLNQQIAQQKLTVDGSDKLTMPSNHIQSANDSNFPRLKNGGHVRRFQPRHLPNREYSPPRRDIRGPVNYSNAGKS